jgi:universal stress protein A
MSCYKHILVGLDLTDEAATVMNKAGLLAQACGAQITIAHVVEPLAFAYGGDVPVDLTEAQQAIQEQAEKRLKDLASESAVTVKGRHVVLGQTASELRHLAQELEADLIVVGSHGRHGLALLLGSTASGIIRGAERDVLAVRV